MKVNAPDLPLLPGDNIDTDLSWLSRVLMSFQGLEYSSSLCAIFYFIFI